MTVWQARYRTKIRQHARVGCRCYGCGGIPTDSDHLFIIRGMGGHDEPELQEDWNIAHLCNACNVARREETAVRAALDKLWRYGPEYIEAKVAALPRKVRPALPKHYFKALELYHQGKKPWRDF